MGRGAGKICAATVVAIAAALLAAPDAGADDGWVAVANSPNHEQQDWGFGPDQFSAEANALAQCAVMQRAEDCRILAVSTDCVATAWDVAQPLNRIHAGSGGGPEAAISGAVAAAGPYANDVQVRCTWWPRQQPGPTSLTGWRYAGAGSDAPPGQVVISSTGLRSVAGRGASSTGGSPSRISA